MFIGVLKFKPTDVELRTPAPGSGGVAEGSCRTFIRPLWMSECLLGLYSCVSYPNQLLPVGFLVKICSDDKPAFKCYSSDDATTRYSSFGERLTGILAILMGGGGVFSEKSGGYNQGKELNMY